MGLTEVLTKLTAKVDHFNQQNVNVVRTYLKNHKHPLQTVHFQSFHLTIAKI